MDVMNLNELFNVDEVIKRADEMIGNSEESDERSEVTSDEVSEKDIYEVVAGCQGATKMEKFGKIISGVARKYSSKWVNGEDLEQELWVKVLGMIADTPGGESDLDERLVAKACYRKAVDYYRYCRRRYEANVQYAPEWSDAETEDRDDYSKLYKSHNMVKDTDYTLMVEALELFPKDSKEYAYVAMKLSYYGDLDPEYWGEEVKLPEEGTAKNGNYREVDFLKLLGYKGEKIPGSWITKKNNMRCIIEEYLRS